MRARAGVSRFRDMRVGHLFGPFGIGGRAFFVACRLVSSALRGPGRPRPRADLLAPSGCPSSRKAHVPSTDRVVPLGAVRGGLRLLLRGSLLPKDVDTIRFLCHAHPDAAPRVRVILMHGELRGAQSEISPELREALERCFLSFLRRVSLPRVSDSPYSTQWEWSAHRDALTCLTDPADSIPS